MKKIALIALLAWAGPALAQGTGAEKAPVTKQRLTPQARSHADGTSECPNNFCT